jgi:hypothetical protein
MRRRNEGRGGKSGKGNEIMGDGRGLKVYEIVIEFL